MASPVSKRRLIQEVRLQRINQANKSLKQSIDRPRIPASEAASMLISYAQSNPDYCLPSIWGPIPAEDDPYSTATTSRGTSSSPKPQGVPSPSRSPGCCVIS